MVFFNPFVTIINIIKKFIYFISKKIFILLLIVVFLAFFIILSFINESKAVLVEGTGIYDTLPYTSSTGSFVVDGVTLPPLPSNFQTDYENFVLVYCPNKDIYILRCLKDGNNTFTNWKKPVVIYDSNARKDWIRYGQTATPYSVTTYEFKPNIYTEWTLTNNFSTAYQSFNTYNISTTDTLLDWLEVIKLSTCQILYAPNDTIFLQPNWDYIWQVQPYIYTSTSDIESWSFDNLVIKGDIPLKNSNDIWYTLQLKLNVNNYIYKQFINYSDISYNGDNWTITIPKNNLFNDLFNSEGNLLNRQFILNISDSADNTNIDYDLGTYDITLTQQQLNDINGQNNFNQQQNLQNILTDSNINDNVGGGFRSFSNGMNINDNTSISTIFNMIYNAFTKQYGWDGSGTPPYELEIPIYLNGESIKISPYSVYGRNWYTDEDNPAITSVKNIVNSVFWFLIGLYVLKDIRRIINSIAEGNFVTHAYDIEEAIL